MLHNSPNCCFRHQRQGLKKGAFGIITGSQWWSIKAEIVPVKWELEERPQKTKKISKTLLSGNSMTIFR